MLPEESQERLPFSKDQVKGLLAVAENEWRGMILLGYHTGIRLSDAANLTWANVDLLKRILVFRARKTAGRAKGGKKDSVVYLHLDLVTYFESLPASDDPNAPIFPCLYRKSPGSHGGLSNAFGRLMHLAGIRAPLGPEKQGKGRQFKALGFHSLRHSFISTLANLKCRQTCANKLLGIPVRTSTGAMFTWILCSRKRLLRIYPASSKRRFSSQTRSDNLVASNSNFCF